MVTTYTITVWIIVSFSLLPNIFAHFMLRKFYSLSSCPLLLPLVYLLLTAVCVSICEPRDVEFFMVHMLKPDRCWFLGPPSASPLSVYGRRATVTALRPRPDGSLLQPTQHSSAFVTATLHAAAPRWRRKQKKKKAGSWRMSGAGSDSGSVSMTEDILQPCRRL